MNALLFLIEQIAPGLYILTAVGVLVLWRRWGRARREFRSTHFELERDIYRYQQANALTGLVLLIEFGLVVVGIQQVVVPTVRATEDTSLTLIQVVDDGQFNTPTPAPVAFGNAPVDPSGVQLGEQEIVRVQATPTLTPTPVGTILPNPPPIAGCDTPGATLQIPANGMLIFDPINVVGTANADNFAFYRFELNGPQTLGNFALLRDHDQPVPEIGVLGQFVPAFYQPGLYQFRLTVFDITNTLKAACTVNITISEPIPTATPLSAGS
jgi:hypothetical protein